MKFNKKKISNEIRQTHRAYMRITILIRTIVVTSTVVSRDGKGAGDGPGYVTYSLNVATRS